MSTPTPVPDLVARAPAKPGPWRWVLPLAGSVLLALGVAWVFAPVVAAAGMCAFVPCEPATPPVGYVAQPDGSVRIEFTAAAAPDVTEIVVVSGADPTWHDSPVLWRVERTGDVPAGWQGDIVLGQTPAGFTETVPLDGDLADATAVGVGNACYGTLADVQPGATGDAVNTGSGPRPLAEFRATPGGLSPCRPERGPIPPVAFALAGAGLAALLAGAFVRARTPAEPGRTPAAPARQRRARSVRPPRS